MSEFEKNYEIDENSPSHIFDEKGNVYQMLAKFKWFGKGDYKLGIRTFYSTADGERLGKGVTFLTEDGPHELTKVLLEDGYGKPEELADSFMEKRHDIIGAVLEKTEEFNPSEKEYYIEAFMNHLGEEESEDDMYDPEDLLDEAI